MHQFPFEKLQVWQKSRILVAEIYQITKSFPKEETYGLTNQVRRAIVSVPSNLAEGCTRKTKNERARFTTIAYSSLMETINQMILAKDLSYINSNFQIPKFWVALISELGLVFWLKPKKLLKKPPLFQKGDCHL